VQEATGARPTSRDVEVSPGSDATTGIPIRDPPPPPSSSGSEERGGSGGSVENKIQQERWE